MCSFARFAACQISNPFFDENGYNGFKGILNQPEGIDL